MDDIKAAKAKLLRSPQTDGVVKASYWTPVQIQNDIIKYVASLAELSMLASEYPEIFGCHIIMSLTDQDLDTIYRVSADNEVTLVSQKNFDLMMTDFYRRLFDTRYMGKAMSVTSQHSTTSVLMKFMKRVEPDEIKIFAFPHESHLCWKKLDFRLLSSRVILGAREAQALDDDEPVRASLPGSFPWIMEELKVLAPAWHSIMIRCENNRALMAWFGSLFERESRNPQFVYMYGDGGDSKGTIMQTLQRIFGKKLYHTENLPEKNSGAMRFFAGSLEGKLLLMCPDNGQMDVFTPFMMALSGGDPLAVEQKGKQTRNAVNFVRPFILSNHRPHIPNKPYARRRIILVPVSPIVGPHIAGYEDVLLDEKIFFFSLCKMVYDSMPSKMEIAQDQSVYVRNVEELDEDIVSLIDQFFVVHPDLKAYREKHEGKIADLHHMTLSEFNLYCHEFFPRYSPKRVREVLVSAYEVSGKTDVAKGKSRESIRVISGIRPRFESRQSVFRVPSSDENGL